MKKLIPYVKGATIHEAQLDPLEPDFHGWVPPIIVLHNAPIGATLALFWKAGQVDGNFNNDDRLVMHTINDPTVTIHADPAAYDPPHFALRIRQKGIYPFEEAVMLGPTRQYVRIDLKYGQPDDPIYGTPEPVAAIMRDGTVLDIEDIASLSEHIIKHRRETIH